MGDISVVDRPANPTVSPLSSKEQEAKEVAREDEVDDEVISKNKEDDEGGMEEGEQGPECHRLWLVSCGVGCSRGSVAKDS